MNRGQSTRVAGVEELQKIERFAPSNLPQQNTIGPMPQRGFEKVTNGDSGHAVLFSSGFEADEVRLSKLYFGGVLDQHDSLVRGNELSQGIQQGGLAAARSAANQEISMMQNVVLKTVRKGASKRTAFDEVRDFEVTDVKFANRKCHAG